MENLELTLKILDTFDLDTDEYCIVSSGSLAARGIRDCNDLDIITTNKLWYDLKLKYPEHVKVVPKICTVISFGEIEFLGEFADSDETKYSSEYQIKTADIINGKRYQNLEIMKYYKRINAREKDLKDLELIKQYENQL